MRKLAKPTEQEINEGPQTVSFQIANGNARLGWILQNQVPNEDTGAEVPSYKLADHRKDGSRHSCNGNLRRRRDQTRDDLTAHADTLVDPVHANFRSIMGFRRVLHSAEPIRI